MAKERKIIYITKDPYWVRDHHRYGGEYLEQKGYHVEIWRIMMQGSIDFGDEKRMYQGNNLFHYTWKQFQIEAKKNLDAIYILQTYNPFYIYLTGLKTVRILMSGLGPMIPQAKPKQINTGLSGSVKRWINRGILLSIRLKRQYRKGVKEKRFLDSFVPANPPTLIVTSTRDAGRFYFHRGEPEERIFYVHSQDYDRFIEANREKQEKKDRYILYIDSTYTGNAYDTAMTGISPGPEKHAKEYQDQLEKVFEKMEAHYGIPVVISGHPHTVYPEGAYSGREITFYRTCEQVRDADCVIMQMSTAISFPLLYDKPMVMVCNDYFKAQDDSRADLFEWMEQSAEYLGIGFINMSNPEEMERPWEKCHQAGREGRRDYIEKYLIDTDKTQKTIIEYLEEEYLSREEFRQA